MRTKRRLALSVLLAAAAAAVLAYPVRPPWWGGWLLAVAEAGIVGGLADWFAVTALFRRPLGLPIPHTGLIPNNWEMRAQRVGTIVGDRMLTREYLAHELALGPQGAVRLIEEHAGDDLQYIRVNGTVVGGLAGGALYGLHLLLRRW